MPIVPDVAASQSYPFLLTLFPPGRGIQWQDGTWHPVTASSVDSTQKLVIAAQALTLAQLEHITCKLAERIELAPWFRHPLSEQFGDCVLSAQVLTPVRDDVRANILSLSEQYGVELALVHNAPSLAKPGLLVMDMDSTVIQIECIDEIARLAGVGEQVSAVTEQAMRGELPFADSLRSRVACLKGVPAQSLQSIRDNIPLMPGLLSLLGVLKQRNWKVAIASGGFTYFADYLMQRLGLDAARSNVLGIVDGTLTGYVEGDIVDAQVKAETIAQLAQRWDIPLSQTIAMGDGANDLLMMSAASLGVAYKAKPTVRQQAQCSINFGGLQTALYYLDGY